MANKADITKLLKRVQGEDSEVYDQLYPLVYDEMRRLAYAHINKNSNQTFSKTDLVHETYLKMVNQPDVEFEDRTHFFAIASRCMRQVLIDYARKKKAEKRGGKQRDLTYIDELYSAGQKKADELIYIDEALNELAKLNSRLRDVVDMRFFGGMKIRDVAKALNVSESTVKRDWKKARGWLYKELKGRYNIDE